jgi:hypothetical protein
MAHFTNVGPPRAATHRSGSRGARIARDHPDIPERMKAGEFRSIRAAAREAGIVRPTALCNRPVPGYAAHKWLAAGHRGARRWERAWTSCSSGVPIARSAGRTDDRAGRE